MLFDITLQCPPEYRWCLLCERYEYDSYSFTDPTIYRKGFCLEKDAPVSYVVWQRIIQDYKTYKNWVKAGRPDIS